MDSRMTVMTWLRRLVVVGLIAGGVPSCASNSQLVNVWSDPDQPPPLRNMLVVHFSRDPARRRLWEDAFVNEFQRRGVDATPSYRLFPNDLPDTNQIVESVRNSRYDGVIMATRLPNETQSRYVPGYVSSIPVTRYNPWYDVYYTHWHDVYEPGTVETEQIARTRTDVWSTEGSGRLVWTGTSEVYDPSSANDVKREVVKKLVPELAKQRIIAGRT